MSRQTLPEGRREQSKHVLYEIEMLCRLAAYFESGEVDRAVAQLDDEGIVVRNALIEAFQIHARQLIDFLTKIPPKRGGKPDMYARYFTKVDSWTLKRTQARQRDFDRFSQRVMHLTLPRATFTDKQRNVDTGRIRSGLGADIERFLKVVDPDLVCDGFVARARKALSSSKPAGSVLGPPVTGATEPMVSATVAPYPTRGTAVMLDDLVARPAAYGPDAEGL